ncbi:hypothetical protein ABEV34_03965 [Methylorubrum rhodesianum]|jgi:hypothetical protein|uniref:Uncharacterized protein n=1 Tax=Methylorubrum rhodesianum TaxID=29427 RepID=A0ABU9Z5L6_9HYPH|nr:MULTISPECIES: hypothetical protein [Methylorubrum]MBY0141332.1 hypothetical protein [Methylorubrum populi]MRI56222.1 hypothetical protein [Methylobacterium sp. DB1607]MBB5760477.1 hypothetical protein [Methylorubrum rhodesianum]MBI1690621.1 hypothetical protein [Methylorubrum sp. DB1722]MBK3402030.1 hypothetical protein [Methylorubrum rhodesianum]
MATFDLPPDRASGDALDRARAQGQLHHSIATTLLVIAAARAEREAPPVSAARRRLAQVYGATRLRKRLEREAAKA